MAEERAQRRLAAILAADVVGFSRLMGEDETGTLTALKQHLSELIRPLIARHRGRVVKTTGDGVLAEFASAVDAVLCAREIQDRMAERNAGTPDHERIVFRIGVNVGDILVDGDDIFGDGVNVAARLEGICRPGGVCVSGTVYDQVRGKLELGFGDLGGRIVKNIAEPVRAYDVTPAPVPSPLPDNQAGHRAGIKRSAAGLAIVAAVAIGLFAAWPTPEPVAPAPVEPAPAQTTKPVAARTSVAVLPLVNLSPDTLAASIADGFSNDITAGLSMISGLSVTAAGSTRDYRKIDQDAGKAGRDLGVGHVVQGSIRQSPDRLELELSLVEVASGSAIWSQRFDRVPQDRFAVLGEIIELVALPLSVQLTADEQARLSRAPTSDMAAYDLFLQARALESGETADIDDIIEAHTLYQQVTTLDPKFAGGFAGLASTLERAAVLGHTKTPDDDIARAYEIAKTAMDLDETSIMARQVAAFAEVASGNLDSAIALYEGTLELAPSNATAHAGLGVTFTYSGRAKDGAAELSEALNLDPLNFDAPYRKLLGLAYFAAGQFAGAISTWEEDQTLRGFDPMILAAMAAAYAELGLDDKANAAKQQLLDTDPEFSAHGYTLLRPFEVTERERLIAVLVKAGLAE